MVLLFLYNAVSLLLIIHLLKTEVLCAKEEINFIACN